MRYVVAIIGTTVSVGLILVSIMMNFRFGQILGKTELDGLIYGIASGCADGFKVILPFTAAWAWRHNRFLVSFASVSLFVIFSAYSITSSLGFSATNRAETTGIRKKAATDYQDLRNSYRQAVSQRDKLSDFRAIGTLQGLLQAKKQNRRWESTNQCTNATLRLSRQYCDIYFKLRAELGTAKKASKLDQRIENLKNQLNQFSGGTVTSGRIDPQVQILKDISGLADNRVEMALTIILTLLVELGSGFGLFVTFGHGNYLPNKKLTNESKCHDTKIISPISIPHAPITDRDWAMQRLLRNPSAKTSSHELYQNYCDWCEEQGREDVMTLTKFCHWLGELGFMETERVEGRVYYNDISIKT